MSNVQRYAQYITEQQRKLNAAGHVNKEEEEIKEALHVNLPAKHAESRYNAVTSHAKKMGYNVHHNEHFSDEKSGNKGTPDITVHYERGDHRGNADPVSIAVHKDGKANKDSSLASIVRGKLKEDADLTQEDIDFINELNKVDELDKKTLDKYSTRARFSSNPKHREGALKAMDKIKDKSKNEK